MYCAPGFINGEDGAGNVSNEVGKLSMMVLVSNLWEVLVGTGYGHVHIV